jgi:Na+-transporting NADH:ubiquinone oxidoreductase subunit E
MGIGFLSFGGMLTGGDEEPKEDKTAEVIKTEAEDTKELANNTKIVE